MRMALIVGAVTAAVVGSARAEDSPRTAWVKSLIEVKTAMASGVSYKDYGPLAQKTDAALQLVQFGGKKGGLSAKQEDAGKALVATMKLTQQVWRTRFEDCIRYAHTTDLDCQVLWVESKDPRVDVARTALQLLKADALRSREEGGLVRALDGRKYMSIEEVVVTLHGLIAQRADVALQTMK
jgi:hypothetical protein